MTMLAFLLQIGDLVNGKFTWRGFIQLTIFVLMGLVVVGFGIMIVYNVIKSLRK